MAWKPDYVTPEELFDYMMVGDLEDTALAKRCIASASRDADRYTHRQFGKVDASQERRYTARWNRRRGLWVVSVDDLRDTAGLTVTIAGATVTYTAEPLNAPDDDMPYTRLVIASTSVGKPTGLDGEVVATTDKWGWAAFPDPVKEATLIQAHRFHWRRNAPAGVAGSPETGSEVRLLARYDVDFCTALHDFRRDVVVVAA